MSLQDDIFDVEYFLKDAKWMSPIEKKATIESFYNIVRLLNRFEEENEILLKENETLRAAIKIVAGTD